MKATNLIFTAPGSDPGPKYARVIAIAKRVGGEFTTVTHTGSTVLAVCDKTYKAWLDSLPKKEPVPVSEPEQVASASPEVTALVKETVDEPELTVVATFDDDAGAVIAKSVDLGQPVTESSSDTKREPVKSGSSKRRKSSGGKS